MQHAREKEAKCTKITHQCEGKWCRQDDIFQWTESDGADRMTSFSGQNLKVQTG